SAVPVRGRGSRCAGIQGDRDFARAYRRDRGRFPWAGGEPLSKDLLPVPFLGSFLVLAAIALIALAVQSRVHVPAPTAEERRGGGRPLLQIVRRPVFVVAALSAAIGYGILNLLMTATPLALSFCAHPFSAAAFVIERHVVGMYAPGFFTGTLIKRFGSLAIILAGIVLMVACIMVAVSGVA